MTSEKDCLVKQGLSPSEASDLLDLASGMSNTSRYDVLLAMGYIKDQVKSVKERSSGVYCKSFLIGLSLISYYANSLHKVQNV